MEPEMTEEERAQLVGRYAHHWCDILYRVMDDIKHTHLVDYLKKQGVALEKVLDKEPDGSMHWIFKMKDNFVYLDSQGKPSEKCVPMTVSFTERCTSARMLKTFSIALCAWLVEPECLRWKSHKTS